MKNNNESKFELTPMLKQSRIYFQIYFNEERDIKKVLHYILNSKSEMFCEEDLKFLKINKKRFREIIGELYMLGFLEVEGNMLKSSKSNRLRLEIKSMKKSMKKYKTRLTKRGIRKYNKAIERRESEIKQLSSKS